MRTRDDADDEAGRRCRGRRLRSARAARVEPAEGILMAQYRCSPDAAFDRLVDISQRTDRRLREVARQLVEAVGSG